MPPNKPITLEICVEAPDTLAALPGLVDRIELCSGLDVGGLTPDAGLMEFAATTGIETHALIRPRSGDFTMEAADLSVAVSSIHMASQIGLAGVVIGAERDGAIDRDALETMMRAADGMAVTLHRVIDVVDDPIAALEVAIDLGVVRVLTSGAAPTAAAGIAGLDRLHVAAAGRIEVMAGAGVTSQTLPELIAKTQVTSFHASCSAKTPIDPRYAAFGFGDASRTIDLDEVARLKAICGAGRILE